MKNLSLTQNLNKSVKSLVFSASALLVLFLVLSPIMWLVFATFMPPKELAAGFLHVPKHFTFQNYRIAFQGYPIVTVLWNTIIVSAVVVASVIPMSCLAAYSFARREFPFKYVIFLSLVFFHMLPEIAIMIPLYIIFQRIGLINSLIGLILVLIAYKLPLAIWLETAYITTIPKEIDECARIDGCSTLGLIRRIIIPISAPGIAVAAIFTFIFTWNDFMVALVLSMTLKSTTLGVGLRLFSLRYGVDWGPMSVAGVLFIIPIIVFVLVAQKYVVQGLTLGSVKE